MESLKQWSLIIVALIAFAAVIAAGALRYADIIDGSTESTAISVLLGALAASGIATFGKKTDPPVGS